MSWQERLTKTRALEILASAPTVLEQFMVRWHYVILEYRKIVGPGGLPERWQGRTWSINGVSEWVSA